jgi:hypothetical protein
MNLSPRSFLLTVIPVACTIVAGMWLYTVFMPLRFLESGYPIWVAKQAILHDCRFGSVLILGDSRAESAIVPAELPESAANITFGGTTPVETYFFARAALKCPHPPELVVYAHSMPAYLHATPGLWKTAARYGYISFRDLRDVAETADRDRDASLASINTSDGLTGLIRDMTYGVGFPSIFMASLIEARGVGRYSYNKVLLERTSVTRGQVIYPQPADKALVGIDADVKDFVPSPLEADYFDKTLDLFASAHVPVLLLTIPVGQATQQAVAPQTKAAFAAFLAEHIDRQPDVIPGIAGLLGWPDDFYVDGSHMNEHGAKAFTERLASCLRQWDHHSAAPKPCDFNWK